jgi:hypothetical protein
VRLPLDNWTLRAVTMHRCLPYHPRSSLHLPLALPASPQEAAGTFGFLRDSASLKIDQPRPLDLTPEAAAMLEKLMLAQAQVGSHSQQEGSWGRSLCWDVCLKKQQQLFGAGSEIGLERLGAGCCQRLCFLSLTVSLCCFCRTNCCEVPSHPH